MMRIRHNVFVEVRDAAGEILERREAKNLVVDTGLDLARDLFGGGGFRPDRIAVGTGTAATTATMTALQAQVYEQLLDRRAATSKKITLQVLIGTGDANGNTLAEEGLFEGTTMVARALISPAIEKTSSKQVTLTHELTFAAG